MSTSICFIDTETTGLDPFLHDAWEIAVILRRDGVEMEFTYRIKPDLSNADAKALEINRYHQRTTADGWQWHDRQDVAQALYSLLNGAVLVGSNPAFDAEMLCHLFGRYYDNPKPWHYRTIDVAQLAVGYLYGQAERMTHRDCDASWYGKVNERIGFPWKSYQASEAVGVPRPAEDVAHTALGDARWARDLYDHITIPDAFYAASDDELSEMASQALTNTYGDQR